MKQYIFITVLSSLVTAFLMHYYTKTQKYCKNKYSTIYFQVASDADIGTVNNIYTALVKDSTNYKTQTIVLDTRYGEWKYECIVDTKLKIRDKITDHSKIGIVDEKCRDELSEERN